MTRKHHDKPDRGYAWIILISCFLLQVLLSSSFSTLGVFMVEYIQYFRQNKALASGIAATIHGIIGLTAAFAGPFTEVYGVRKTAQAGTVLVTGGLCVSSLAPNIYVLYITHGLIAGMGYSCWVVSGFVVQYFFEKRRGFAIAISSAGLSFGVLFWSLLTPYLIDRYTFKGALVIMGGINLNGFVLASIFREPHFKHLPKNVSGIELPTNEDARDTVCQDATSTQTHCIANTVLACYTSVGGAILGDIAGMEKLSRAVGHSVCLVAIGVLISTALAGFLVDSTGNAALPFLLMGLIQTLGGFVGYGVYYESKKKLQHHILCSKI